MGRYEGQKGFDVPEAETDMVSVREGSRELVAETLQSGDDSVTMKRSVRSDAAFVTQLIATAIGSPQTRAARRAAPAEAAIAYGAAPVRRIARAGLSRLS
jgi:nucleoid-associated protein YgaU